MAFDVAGVGMEGEDRGGVEMGAGANGRIERAGIADTPIDRVQFRIVGAGDPCRSATELPGVALPGIAAGFIRGGNGVSTPQMLARRRIPTVDEAAGAELRARYTGQDDAVRDQRPDRHRIAFLDVGGLLAP